MFDIWLEQEKEAIQSRFRSIRIACVALAVLMIPSILMQVFFFLDGDGVMAFIPIIFYILIMVFVLTVSNYKKRFIKPFLASVQQELTTKEKQEEFAQQMREQARCISCQPLPQMKACDFMAAKDYCYIRQPRKSRIIQNHQLCRVVFTEEPYMVGRGHMRSSYALALYTVNEEKPVWMGYFMRQEEAEQAFQLIRDILPPEAIVQDDLSNPPEGSQKSLWKDLLDLLPMIIVLAILVFLVKYFVI